MKQPNWTRILTILLVILASFAVLYITFSILLRFTQVIFLLVISAILAYVLSPLVNRIAAAFHVRWLAILFSYLLVAVAFMALGVLLFTPFIDQSKSLVDNLQTPSRSSLQAIAQVQKQATQVQSAVQSQHDLVTAGGSLSAASVRGTRQKISALQIAVSQLPRGTISGPSQPSSPSASPNPARSSPNPRPQTQVPPSYVAPITTPLNRLAADYNQAVPSPSSVDNALLGQAVSDAKKTLSAIKTTQASVSSTPILLLRSQVWLDQHHISINLHNEFGQAAEQISNQGTNILNNAITILSATASTLLDMVLILIISFYLLNEGKDLIRGSVEVIPAAYREQAWYFIQSLDRVLGGYIRGQIVLSIMAGILGGGGAAVLGVPYPLLIGLITAVLEIIPVIGPMITVIPALLIALFFTNVVTTVIILVWFVVFQQIVTNVLSPRIMGIAVGISPLEAIVAVLVGYPLGGLLGAFLAVPLAGLLHILIREAYAYFVLGHALPTAQVPVSGAQAEPTSVPAAGRADAPPQDVPAR